MKQARGGPALQRKVKGFRHDFLVDDEPVMNPFSVEMLVPGWYRLRDTE